MQIGNSVFPAFKDIKNIDFRWDELPYQESIVLHKKWRKNGVTNFQELPLKKASVNEFLREAWHEIVY